MSLLDKRVSEDDINRVNAIRYHPKYEPGFEKECREEKVWYLRDRRSGGKPYGYNLFNDVQEQFDMWQAQQTAREAVRETGRGARVNASAQSNIRQNTVKKVETVGRETIWDKLEHFLLKYVELE